MYLEYEILKSGNNGNRLQLAIYFHYLKKERQKERRRQGAKGGN